MKKLIAILAAGTLYAVASAQTFVTNGDSVLTVSNGNVIATAPLVIPVAPAPPLVSTNGYVVPQAFIDALAQATGIPEGVLRVIPLKGLFWLFIISVGLPVAARWARKLIPDDLQTGKLGTALKHAALEINPALTPTPPDVAIPKTELKDTQTGAIVSPQPVKSPSTPTN